MRPRPAQARNELLRPHRLQQTHRRNVQRQLQGLAHPDFAPEQPVEVLRRIAAKIHLPVGNQGFGMRQPPVKGQPIDQWLQG